MAATRLMPTEIGDDLIALTREICDKSLRPQVDDVEARAATEEVFPREVFRTLGRAGLLSLPYPEELGGGGQPYEIYLQVVEEIASAWAAVAVGVSVHSLTAYAVHTYGSPEQQQALLPDMLSGETLGAYALSEPLAGSDIGAMTTRATADGDDWRIRGRKAWISHAGHADYYTTFARTSDDGGRGVSCFVVPADAPGLSFGTPEKKMGLHGDTVREVIFEDAPVSGDRQIGELGRGVPMALAGLDAGRLGIAAVATGLAQSALAEIADTLRADFAAVVEAPSWTARWFVQRGGRPPGEGPGVCREHHAANRAGQAGKVFEQAGPVLRDEARLIDPVDERVRHRWTSSSIRQDARVGAP